VEGTEPVRTTSPRWVRMPQGQTWKHISEVPREFQFVTRPTDLLWGFGLYYVNSDGTLTLAEHDFDTSD